MVTVNDPGLVGKYAAEAAASNEVWVDYTDDAPPLRAKHPGDPRAAFTPWLADKVHCIIDMCLLVHFKNPVRRILRLDYTGKPSIPGIPKQPSLPGWLTRQGEQMANQHLLVSIRRRSKQCTRPSHNFDSGGWGADKVHCLCTYQLEHTA